MRTGLLTPAQVAKMLKARGLKASPAEVEQLTRMMNDDLEREAQEAAEQEKQAKAVDRFFDQFWAPVRKERAKPKKR